VISLLRGCEAGLLLITVNPSLAYYNADAAAFDPG
jgi:hypothetical protein